MPKYRLTTYQNGVLGRSSGIPERLVQRRTIYDVRNVRTGIGFPFFQYADVDRFIKDTGAVITERIIDRESEFIL